MAKPKSKDISSVFKQKHRKNKRTKTTITFDDTERNEFLTGFRKRKTERRKKAQEEMITQLKEEKRRKKQEQRQLMLKQTHSKHCQPLPEGPAIPAEPQIYSLPRHTVTVTDITQVDYTGATGLMLGTNQGEVSEDECAENGKEDAAKEDLKSTSSKESTKSKKPKKKSKHISMTHLMDKHVKRKLKKRHKTTKQERQQLKNRKKKK